MTAISRAFRCFDEVARRGSIRKAAGTLHLTPAAVQQQIANLEADVGIPLFDRLPRGVRLTAAGELLVATVRRCQRDYDNALASIEEMRSLRRGHIHLAVTNSSAEQLLPEVIRSTMDSYPGLTYEVRTGSGEDIVRWVASGEVDFGFCLRRKVPPGVVVARAFAQCLGAVYPPGHPLSRHAAGGAPLRLRDCLEYPLILMSKDTELRAMVEQIGAQGRRAVSAAVQTTSIPLVRRLIAGGAGIGVLIPENVADDVERGVLCWHALGDAAARSGSCIYQRSGQVTTAAAGVFLQHLEAALRALHARFGLDDAEPHAIAP
ncbi:MAG: LysR family transcriptional regulator [Lautropia sp.]